MSYYYTFIRQTDTKYNHFTPASQKKLAHIVFLSAVLFSWRCHFTRWVKSVAVAFFSKTRTNQHDILRTIIRKKSRVYNWITSHIETLAAAVRFALSISSGRASEQDRLFHTYIYRIEIFHRFSESFHNWIKLYEFGWICFRGVFVCRLIHSAILDFFTAAIECHNRVLHIVRINEIATAWQYCSRNCVGWADDPSETEKNESSIFSS